MLSAPEGPVDLLAQVADVDVDDVRAVLVLVVPGVLEQLVAGEHLPGPPHERLRAARTPSPRARSPARPRQTWRLAGSRRRSPTLEHGRALARPAPREGSQARQQLRERERLGQVVVGASVEPRDPVLDGVARGQHQDRGPRRRRRGAARQVSKPSMPGSITSRTIASYSVEPAIQSASSPSRGEVGGDPLLVAVRGGSGRPSWSRPRRSARACRSPRLSRDDERGMKERRSGPASSPPRLGAGIRARPPRAPGARRGRRPRESAGSGPSRRECEAGPARR